MTPRTRLAALAALVVVVAACADIDRSINAADRAMLDTLANYERLNEQHRLLLAQDTERGERLFVLGRLVSMETGLPLANHRITAYQADHDGSYDAAVAGNEATARLNGDVQTDLRGRFFISTILPGDYGTTANNRHIHMSVSSAMPEAYDFYFMQYINAGLLSWARGSDQAVVLELQALESGGLVAAADVPVRGVR